MHRCEHLSNNRHASPTSLLRGAGVYSKTVNLPQTAFDMRANSVVREPQLQKFWEEQRIYERLSRDNPGVSRGSRAGWGGRAGWRGKTALEERGR